MAQQLLQPDTLSVGLRSGLFLSSLRRTGKTTFLRQDLIPALEVRGALVIYVDLWSDVQASPAALVHSALATALGELQKPARGCGVRGVPEAGKQTRGDAACPQATATAATRWHEH